MHFGVTTGIIHRPQPGATIARLADAVAARAPFELAGLSPIVTVSGSLIAALALFEGAVGADSVWAAAQVDEAWQAEQWGEDDLADRARAAPTADLAAGARLLALLRQRLVSCSPANGGCQGPTRPHPNRKKKQ